MDWQAVSGWVAVASVVGFCAVLAGPAIQWVRGRTKAKPTVKEARAAFLTLVQFLPKGFKPDAIQEIRAKIAQADMPIPGVDE